MTEDSEKRRLAALHETHVRRAMSVIRASLSQADSRPVRVTDRNPSKWSAMERLIRNGEAAHDEPISAKNGRQIAKLVRGLRKPLDDPGEGRTPHRFTHAEIACAYEYLCNDLAVTGLATMRQIHLCRAVVDAIDELFQSGSYSATEVPNPTIYRADTPGGVDDLDPIAVEAHTDDERI